MLTLYYCKKSCAYAPHILLHDAEADFEVKHIDFDTGEQTSPEFLAINIKGRVPALATPNGILTENHAILLYIAQMYPDKKLAPQDPFSLAEAQAFYAVHSERPFFGELVSFMSRGPIVAAILEKNNAVEEFRKLIGSTNPSEAAEGTIRNLYATSMGENAVHGSDSNENAEIEGAFHFSKEEILS